MSSQRCSFQGVPQRSALTSIAGAQLLDSGVMYRVWAPVVGEIFVEVYSGGGDREVRLARDEFGFHTGFDPEGRAGDLYKYRADGRGPFPDPASRYQPQGVHGPSMVVAEGRYRWRHRAFERAAFRNLVIYELHVGTFSPKGSFDGVIERLGHLVEMGVNAVELMPIAEFAGSRNWGYDGVYLYAPCHVYGEPDDLRGLVDACHGAGLAVILDVVYNHFGPDGNYLGCFIGDYLDEEQKTPWGGAIRYGSPEFGPLRRFVIENVRYWMEEFAIDGFRLDATHAISDGSSRHILAEICEMIHALGGYAIAEDARNDATLVTPGERGGMGFDGVWADDFHHAARVSVTGEGESYLGDFRGSTGELVETLNRGWLYSGQVSRFLGGARGSSAVGLPPARFIHCISNHDQVGNRAFGERLSHSIGLDSYLALSVLICLSPHTPMLFMGQEWAASTPFRFFTDHNEELGALVTAGRREEFAGFTEFRDPKAVERIPDPQAVETHAASGLRWEEVANAPHDGVLALYRTCLRLRERESAFRPESTDGYHAHELAEGVVAIWFRSNESEWLLLVDSTGGHEASLSGLPVVVEATQWRKVLSSREVRFGGDGGCALGEAFDRVEFGPAEAIVLKKVLS